ncbi:MAG: efflux RND transporter periplasmic adaptor subunit [Acidobacteria bacterium]|nr:efflux RND transporter periplasmic adaptor subunit [Acidobacteriota bacterium]
MTKYLSIAAACLAISACGGKHEEEAPVKPVVTVKVARAEMADIRRTVQSPGTVFPREQVNIAARLTAVVESLGARKGDAVSKGQVLVRLQNRDLAAQRQEAVAGVADAEATFQKMTSGTLPADVERARGQVISADAALKQAQKFYDRRKDLFDKGAIPNKDVVQSQTDLAQAKSAHDVASKSLQLLESQSREKDIQIAQSRLDAAKARLALIEAQLAFAEIRSPMNGTVTEQFLYPGDMAKPDSPIFTLMDLSVAIARAQVPESEAAGVRLQQTCSFTSGDSSGAAHTGRVAVINQSVDAARRTVEVWCEIPNGSHTLRGGTFGSVTIATGAASRGILVPLAAVQFEEGTRKGVVMVALASNKAEKREVEAGNTYGAMVEIRKGVKEGDPVIIEGGYSLPENAEIHWSDGKK